MEQKYFGDEQTKVEAAKTKRVYAKRRDVKTATRRVSGRHSTASASRAVEIPKGMVSILVPANRAFEIGLLLGKPALEQ